ncbi:hypothetical protein RLIN73S_07490 [Rhodanobacter lindaniclasticus]
MELVLAAAIGILAASGVWLLLRPRTFQVIIGLTLISYAVEALHLLHRRPAHRRRSGAARGGRRRGAVCRPAAAGAGAHRDRDRLRHHGPVPGRAADFARVDRQRSRRRRGTARREPASDHRADPDPAAGGRAAAADRREAPAHGADVERRRVRGAGAGLRRADAHGVRRGRAGRGLPHRRLAGALRHRAGGGPALGPDGAAHQRAGAGTAAVCAGPLAASRGPLPAAAAVPVDGLERRLPHRRPVQPVRVLRGAAGGVVRPGAAWFGCATGQRGAALHSPST